MCRRFINKDLDCCFGTLESKRKKTSLAINYGAGRNTCNLAITSKTECFDLWYMIVSARY